MAHDTEVYFNEGAALFDPLAQALDAAKRELERDGVVYRPGEHNRYIMRMGYLMNLYGMDESLVTEWAKEEFSD